MADAGNFRRSADTDHLAGAGSRRGQAHIGRENPWAIPIQDHKVFGKAFDLFKAHHCVNKKPRTAYEYNRAIELYFLPRFKLEQLKDITLEAITDITDRLARTPSAQAHALSIARTFFKWRARVVGENHIRADPREEVESRHHPARCLPSSICLQRLSSCCSSRGTGLKSRISFSDISSMSP